MDIKTSDSKDYQRIEAALHFVAMNFQNQPSLADIAESVHLSEFHFQRLFNRWVGVSPKQFLQYLTLQYARDCLSSGSTVLDTALDSGLAAPARLGELFVRLEAVTPGEFRRQGNGLLIRYGYHSTPFGGCLIGLSERGITGLQFCDPGGHKAALAEMQSRLPQADYCSDQESTAYPVSQIFNRSLSSANRPLSVLVAGTAFQIKVWEALLRLPAGSRVSYQQLATDIGKPKAVRAIGTAIGRNPLALLIPCHRVIRSDGLLGGYHWGLGRKLALQGWESVQQDIPAARQA